MNKKDYTALLMINEITAKNKDSIVVWLRKIAKEIKKENHKVFAKPCKFRLMK